MFKYEDAKEFQKYLLKKYSHSMQMAHRTISSVKEFFFWLKEQDGYKKLAYDDIISLQLSLKDRERARASKPREYLDAEKWQDLILNLNPESELDFRGRAMLACLLLTSVRVDALISLKIGDFNFEKNYLYQDADHVNTKFASSHKTNLWKFRPEIRQILIDWIIMLQNKYGFSDNDPLFPKIRITTNDMLQFENDGFLKEHIKSTSTLVELAIVIVIMGLLVGGVLVGQELIQQAKIRNVIIKIKGYDTAIATFRAKYSTYGEALPGDFKNASKFGLDKDDNNRKFSFAKFLSKYPAASPAIKHPIILTNRT